MFPRPMATVQGRAQSCSELLLTYRLSSVPCHLCAPQLRLTSLPQQQNTANQKTKLQYCHQYCISSRYLHRCLDLLEKAKEFHKPTSKHTTESTHLRSLLHLILIVYIPASFTRLWASEWSDRALLPTPAKYLFSNFNVNEWLWRNIILIYNSQRE